MDLLQSAHVAKFTLIYFSHVNSKILIFMLLQFHQLDAYGIPFLKTIIIKRQKYFQWKIIFLLTPFSPSNLVKLHNSHLVKHCIVDILYVNRKKSNTGHNYCLIFITIYRERQCHFGLYDCIQTKTLRISGIIIVGGNSMCSTLRNAYKVISLMTKTRST